MPKLLFKKLKLLVCIYVHSINTMPIFTIHCTETELYAHEATWNSTYHTW